MTRRNDSGSGGGSLDLDIGGRNESPAGGAGGDTLILAAADTLVGDANVTAVGGPNESLPGGAADTRPPQTFIVDPSAPSANRAATWTPPGDARKPEQYRFTISTLNPNFEGERFGLMFRAGQVHTDDEVRARACLEIPGCSYFDRKTNRKHPDPEADKREAANSDPSRKPE